MAAGLVGKVWQNLFSRSAWRGWRHLAANAGWTAIPVEVAARVRRRLKRPGPPAMAADEALHAHPFDEEHGVDTSGLIWGDHLPSGSRNDAWNTAYYGTSPSVFRAAMDLLRPDFYQTATFIDLGSGKARAVMMAMDYGFARVIGVEISPDLHRVAVDNVAKYCDRSGVQVELLRQDAALFEFPEGPLVVYFFQPFCRPVMKCVIENLKQSFERDPREIAVVYVNPVSRDVLDEAKFLERVAETRLALDEADRRADLIGSSGEDCIVYRARR